MTVSGSAEARQGERCCRITRLRTDARVAGATAFSCVVPESLLKQPPMLSKLRSAASHSAASQKLKLSSSECRVEGVATILVV